MRKPLCCSAVATALVGGLLVAGCGKMGGAWKTDISAFRKAVAEALEAVPKPAATKTPFGAPNVDGLASPGAVREFQSKEVRWKITFLGLTDKGEVDFRESGGGKGKTTFVGKTEEFILLSLKPDPASLADWRALPRNTVVDCKARISGILTGARFSKDQEFIGWLAYVSLEKGKPVK